MDPVSPPTARGPAEPADPQRHPRRGPTSLRPHDSADPPAARPPQGRQTRRRHPSRRTGGSGCAHRVREIGNLGGASGV